MNNPSNSDVVLGVVAGWLDRFERVPDDVLWEIATRDGACMQLSRSDIEPVWTQNEATDRELAAQICANCPVQWECLELQLRTSGDQTLGVWGALPAEDVRALYPVWRSRRRQRGTLPGDQNGDGFSGQDGGQR
ncbi:WhiB family transcriptional regulator [Actinophytocola sp.]|uniref:WhiB family transcriptional regulator n=1 Tax=Actinophytocola sp. TaxID=1872138 RepID=UPI002ED0EAE4